jgi:cobalt-zinc-cadmium resistance protein CzcA
LERFPEIEKIVTKIGSGEVPTDPMPMEASDMMVILKPKKEWTSAKTFDELSEKMGVALKEIPGVSTGFQYPVQMRFNELMTGARQDVVCKIFGENLDTLAHYAQQLGGIVSTVNGAKDLYVEAVSGLPQIIVNYRRNLIAQYRLNIEDINKMVNTSLAGQTAGSIYEGEKRFDLVVRLKGELKKNVADIQQLLIPTPDGTQIPLSMLADVVIEEGPNQIQREDAKRRIVVGFNVRGRDVQSIVDELQQKTKDRIQLPAGYYITYGGAFENLNAAKQRLLIAVPVSLLLIFILLYFAFNSIKQGLLIYSAIPLSAIGGILFLALRGMPFSISAGVGFIALFGVAVLNGIVLIAEFNRLKSEGMNDSKKIVLEGTRSRLRPVLMTAFVASLGFLPMALSNGAGAEVQRPLATVVIGGLLIASFLTLFVLPVLYIMFEAPGQNLKKGYKTTILLVGIIFIHNCHAQTPISLPAAIDTALKNNLLVKHDQLKMQYQQMLTQTARNIPATQMIGDIGQVNSIYVDTKLGISQSILLPKVYSSQKALLMAEWKSSQLDQKITEADIKRQVTQVYYSMLYNQQQQLVLKHTDSLYEGFYKKAILRLQKGEANILEKLSAETQLGQIRNQLHRLQQEAASWQLQFQYLLNSVTPFMPSAVFKSILTTMDTSSINNHPTLQRVAQEQANTAAALLVEKSKLLPSFGIGYSNASIQGIGADDKRYTAANRFHSAQLQMSIPIFNKSQKNKINSAQFSQNIALAKYTTQQQLLINQFKQLLTQYQQDLQTVAYYESTALPNAQRISQTASLQLSNGNINYLEWVQLIHQATAVQTSYIDAIKDMNNTVIQLQFLSQQ